MTKRFRHLPGRGHMFLVLMLVLTSIVPATLHAATMTASMVGGKEQATARQGVTADHSMMSHHHEAKGGHDPAAHDHMPANHGGTQDNCCPMSCAYALCSIAPPIEAVFIHDSFEIGPILGFVVAAVAMPERPPRA